MSSSPRRRARRVIEDCPQNNWDDEDDCVADPISFACLRYPYRRMPSGVCLNEDSYRQMPRVNGQITDPTTRQRLRPSEIRRVFNPERVPARAPTAPRPRPRNPEVAAWGRARNVHPHQALSQDILEMFVAFIEAPRPNDYIRRRQIFSNINGFIRLLRSRNWMLGTVPFDIRPYVRELREAARRFR
jgi:hypothetical protein